VVHEEQPVRVVAVLHGEEALVVGTPERLLPPGSK
jgi:hypothetical protein